MEIFWRLTSDRLSLRSLIDAVFPVPACASWWFYMVRPSSEICLDISDSMLLVRCIRPAYLAIQRVRTMHGKLGIAIMHWLPDSS